MIKNNNKITNITLSPPPPGLPIYGRVDPATVSFIGRTNYGFGLEEKKFIFGIKRNDRKYHLYTIGKGGVGKSKLLELLIRQDIVYDYGLIVIDESNYLIHNILDFIPKYKVNDVCLIDFNDKSTIAFNPFANVDINFRNQFVNDFIYLFKIYILKDNSSTTIDNLLRFILLSLFNYQSFNLESIIFFLKDENFRKKVLSLTTDKILLKFWLEDFTDDYINFNKGDINLIINSIYYLLSNNSIRKIFLDVINKVNFDDLISQKKIILVNLGMNSLEKNIASFLGSLIILKLQETGLKRHKNLLKNNDFYIYVNNFNHLANDVFKNLIINSYDYGYKLNLAHQYLSQLSENWYSLLLSTIGNIIIFRLSGEDAVKLRPEMFPVFDIKDMIGLGLREFYIKMLIDNEIYEPFSAETLKILPAPHPSYARNIIQASHKKYNLL
ncbi:MAG: hypothetical protein ACP5IC_02190 [Minisyncoccia bacterium]